MEKNVSLALIQSVVDSQEDLIVVFKDDNPIVTNRSFNKFFTISSCEEYVKNFGAFVNNFVPHPLYFHKEKMHSGETWFDGVLKLPEIDRVISMMTSSYEPHAFSVALEQTTPGYTIATFKDITQDLIKRIMIENNANIDLKSGAYAKDYFLHISRSYQDAAQFNEKIIGAILITIKEEEDNEKLTVFAEHFKNNTRQDDMLIRWYGNSFLLVYLVDSESNAQLLINKFESVSHDDRINKSDYTLKLFTQQKDETINT